MILVGARPVDELQPVGAQAVAAWYRDVQSRHAGVVTVGRVSHSVEFTEAGDHAGNETGLDNALDEAYRTKYGRSSGAVERITAEQARATTLRLDPA